MKLNSYFKQFLSNIEPSAAQTSGASTSHNAVRDHLAGDREFKTLFKESFLAGSYARDTAVRPIQDVDIIVVAEWDDTPSKLLSTLKAALDRNKNYKTKTSPQRRSICIELGHISMDIVPARPAIFAPLEVPDRTQKEWVATNPRGHTAWVTELNKKSKDKDTDQGRFVPLVKMMKHWRGYQLPSAKHPKGFWTEVLAGNSHDVSKRDWADVFIDCLERIEDDQAFAYALKQVPSLQDPGLPHQTLQTGIESAEFAAFYEEVVSSLALARQARDHKDEAESAALWIKVFGPKFPTPDMRKAMERTEGASTVAGVASLITRSTRDIREPEEFG